MSSYLPIIIPIVFLALVTALLLLVSGKKTDKKKHNKHAVKAKDHNTILKEANRRLAVNPKDPEALLALADLYYRDQTWDRALKTYELLAEICGGNPEIDEFLVNLRVGICALKLNKLELAYKGFLIARTVKQDNFDVNYNLGVIEYNKKNYEKAVPLLKQAAQANTDHAQALRFYGLSLFRTKAFREALGMLRKAVDLEPEDKESLFAMGECYFELGQQEQALKIFSHLRTDPKIGPNAALFSGTIHLNQRQFPKAIMDFEIGLKHQNVKIETIVELKYRLAMAYLKQQEISKAVVIFNEIQDIFPNYKDVPAQVGKYKELNASRNLQVFLLAPTSDFVTLCRKISVGFFPRAKIKITDISVTKNDWADILAEVETSKWQDLVLFRYIRSTGQVGELIVRDLYAKIKDVKAGKGYCMTAGSFTDEAKRFVEARLIDLMEKDQLNRLLNKIDSASISLPEDPEAR